jgi:GT2 family glycosyltransferase
MINMSKIGLVTVLYKCDEVLPDFFKSVYAQDFTNYILYIIDNSASEATDAMLSSCISQYPIASYQYINSGANVGVAAGNNIGINAALKDDCSHILLLNNDIALEQQNVFSTLLSVSDTDSHALVVPLIYYYDSRKIWMAGGYMDKWRALGVHDGYNKEEAPSFKVGKKITYAPTCFMLVKREVFEQIGIMDEKYFAYYDDTDFVYRALKTGYTMYYEPSVSVLHKVSSSTGGDSSFYVYYSARNKIYFIRKNLTGIYKLASLLYFFTSRIVFWLKYDKAKRKKLMQGIKDGFGIPL